jgi:Lrp/AsnC family transcriptional regulator, regulator for asnA, asnC and gidA
LARALDDTERAIIRALQSDGRMSITDLSQKLKVSKVTVSKKLNTLLDDGVITIQANANPYDLGFGAPCFIGMDVDRSALEEVATAVAKLPQVEMVAVCNEYDLLIKVSAESTDALYNFIMHDLSKFPAIRDTRTMLAFRFFKHESCRQIQSSQEE